MYHDQHSARQLRFNTIPSFTTPPSNHEHRRILRRNPGPSNNNNIDIDQLVSPNLPQRPVPLLGSRPTSTKFPPSLISSSQRWNPKQSQSHHRAYSAESVKSPSPIITNPNHCSNQLPILQDPSYIQNHIRAASYPRPPQTDIQMSNPFSEATTSQTDRQGFRRIRQHNRPATFSYRPLSVRTKKATSGPIFPQHPNPIEQQHSPVKERAPRAVYNATTASAKAAALASANPPKGVLVEPRNTGSSRRLKAECDDLSTIQTNRSDLTSRPRSERDLFRSTSHDSQLNVPAKKHSRIVVKRRVIRGSSIFRHATEADIDEYLQLERHREMVNCTTTAVNIPPGKQDHVHPLPEDNNDNDRELCANCTAVLSVKKTIPKRGVRRVSSLLTKHLGLDAEGDHTIDLHEMAAMDEQKAVSIFLSEIRKYRKEFYFSSHNRVPERISTATMKYRDSRRAAKKEKYLNSKEYEKLHNMASVRRTFSADDPALMRALLHQERLLSTHSANHRKKEMNKQPGTDIKINTDISIFNADRYSRERSRSDLIPQRKMEQVDVEETCRRYIRRFAGRSGFAKPRFGRLRSIETCEDRYTDSPCDSSRQRSTLTPESEDDDDDDEYSDDQVRVLTAMEPVDPTLSSNPGNVRRSSSYHIGFAMPGFGNNWRRSQHRASDGTETKLLRRLLSLRRRGEDRS